VSLKNLSVSSKSLNRNKLDLSESDFASTLNGMIHVETIFDFSLKKSVSAKCFIDGTNPEKAKRTHTF
jgi:hypothetical protein